MRSPPLAAVGPRGRFVDSAVRTVARRGQFGHAYISRCTRASAARPMRRPRTHRYVEQVEPPSSSGFSRAGRRFRAVNPWVIDAFLGTAVHRRRARRRCCGDAGPEARLPRRATRSRSLLVARRAACRSTSAGARRSRRARRHRRRARRAARASASTRATCSRRCSLVAAYTRRRVLPPASSARSASRAIAVGLLVVASSACPTRPRRTSRSAARSTSRRIFFGSTHAQPPALHASSSRSAPRPLERERDEEAKRAVADERLRIAQELHDVVAHSMGVIAVQAGVGAHVIDTDPAEAKKSLEAIAHDEPLDAHRDPPAARRAARRRAGPRTQPAPGLADLDRLVADLGAAGVPVDVTRRRRRATTCRPASTSPRTASCRRRSPTC